MKTDFNAISVHACADDKNYDLNNCISTKEVSKIPYLGVIFDESLKRNLYINILSGSDVRIHLLNIKILNEQCLSYTLLVDPSLWVNSI